MRGKCCFSLHGLHAAVPQLTLPSTKDGQMCLTRELRHLRPEEVFLGLADLENVAFRARRRSRCDIGCVSVDCLAGPGRDGRLKQGLLTWTDRDGQLRGVPLSLGVVDQTLHPCRFSSDTSAVCD